MRNVSTSCVKYFYDRYEWGHLECSQNDPQYRKMENQVVCSKNFEVLGGLLVTTVVDVLAQD